MTNAKRKYSAYSDVRCRLGKAPDNDKGYFEEMTKAVFRSGMKWDVVDKKWPDFRKAFSRFSIKTIAKYKASDMDRLLEDEGIIRNRKKIKATVDNAREFLALQKDYGSFKGYLTELYREGEDALCRDLGARFAFMGAATSLFFLRAVGEEMPKTMNQLKGLRGRPG